MTCGYTYDGLKLLLSLGFQEAINLSQRFASAVIRVRYKWLQAPDLNQRLQTNQSHVLLDPVGGSELVGTGGILRSLVSQASEAVTDLVGLPRPRSTAGPQVVQGLKTEIVYRCLRSYTVVHACILDKYWTERRQATLKPLKMLASRRGFEPLLAP